jgi:hypothetical protein
MAANAHIRIEGMNELLKRIDSVQKLKFVKSAMVAGGNVMRGYIATYPSSLANYTNPLLYGKTEKAAKMRRGYFARLKKGAIEVPYRRGQSPGSEKLGQSWKVTTRNYGLTAVVGTSVKYARRVQDRKNQTIGHGKTGWVTVQDVAEQHGREVIDKVRAALNKELSK